MDRITFIVFITTTFLITSCTQQPIQYVERNDLLKSMIYTQRHLVELAYNPDRSSQLPRKQLLEQSHCDLIHRQVVYTAIRQSQCKNTNTAAQTTCISRFHQCIGQCSNAKRLCKPCERKAINCLHDTRLSHEKS